jgi:hypothetical protein
MSHIMTIMAVLVFMMIDFNTLVLGTALGVWCMYVKAERAAPLHEARIQAVQDQPINNTPPAA